MTIDHILCALAEPPRIDKLVVGHGDAYGTDDDPPRSAYYRLSS